MVYMLTVLVVGIVETVELRDLLALWCCGVVMARKPLGGHNVHDLHCTLLANTIVEPIPTLP
jgi:hypothetical protein